MSVMSAVLIPTDFRYDDPRERPMCEWLIANKFTPNNVPRDAWICIRDETCLGVELYVRDTSGRVKIDEAQNPERRVEWRPMVEPPPAILLPASNES